MSLVKATTTLFFLVAAAACYSPVYQECKLQCSVDGDCPDDTDCQSDGFCHAPGEALCTSPPDAEIVVSAGGLHSCQVDAADRLVRNPRSHESSIVRRNSGSSPG